MAELKDANTNPWYVLMTLYGEQEGERVNNDLHDRNRAVWNAWSCQGLDDAAAAEVAKQAQVDVAETRGWAEIAEKVKRKHRAEMKKRNNDVADYTYPGFPDFEEPIGCSEIQFFNTVVLNNCIFTQRADFFSAKFTRTASFHAATFTQTVDFASATFTQTANFESATFTRLAFFFSATFTQTAYFCSAKFTQDANFHVATFSRGANFSSSTFTQTAYFAFATFTQDADFISATFDGPAKFTETKFGVKGADTVCVPTFTEASFAKLMSFRLAEFVSHYPVLEGTGFHEAVVVTAKDDYWPSPNLDLLAVVDKKAPHVPTKEVAKDSCAKLRNQLAKQGLPEEEHFFFRREMRFAGQIGSLLERLPYLAFGWLSNFGQSIGRPIEWLCGVFGLGVGLFGAHLSSAASLPSAIGEGAALSFSNLLPLFGFGRLYFDKTYMAELPTGLQVWAGAQTVVALPLLFFLGLGLRKQFRLR